MVVLFAVRRRAFDTWLHVTRFMSRGVEYAVHGLAPFARSSVALVISDAVFPPLSGNGLNGARAAPIDFRLWPFATDAMP